MTSNALRLSATAVFVISFQCRAAGLEGGTPSEASLPADCNFEQHKYDSGPIPRRPSQKQIPKAVSFNAVAEEPRGKMRKVSFNYHFSGLQDIVPANFIGDFKIRSTQVTVLKGPSVSYGKASSITFNDGTGNVMLPNTSVIEGPAAFQDIWTIRIKSTGSHQVKPGKKAQPATVTLSCPMPINITPTPVPTLTQ
jgi:hypothetical protein